MWQSLITDLQAAGVTQKEIAAACGCSQAFVSDISRGRHRGTVSYDLGTALKALHAQRCQSQTTSKQEAA
jgi:transcriptional regulator with XRE-family HTH domain